MRKLMLMLAAIMASLAAFVPAAGADLEATNGKIAFVSARDGNTEIYTVNPDGSELTRLTNAPQSDRTPAWSPDGKKIAFASRRSGNSEIYVMNADGTDVRQLTNHPATDACPSWSPDGTRIAFDSRRAGNVQIFDMNAADGSEVRQLTSGSDSFSACARYSSGGSKITLQRVTFTEPVAVYTMKADGSDLTKVTEDSLKGANPDWSPEGNRIAFVNNFCPTCDLSDVFVIKSNGSGLTQLTHDFGNNLYPSWSPDGNLIAFDHSEDGFAPQDVYTMNSDGTGLTNLTNNPAPDFEADWGPAG